MRDADRTWIKLFYDARNLSGAEIQTLKNKLKSDPSNFEIRIQLLSFYSEIKGNALKHKAQEHELVEHVGWIIKNKPMLNNELKPPITAISSAFKPKNFATLRQLWLDQVAKDSSNSAIITNAASFIAWNDIETASHLYEAAYSLNPAKSEFDIFIIHLNSQFHVLPPLYHDEIRNRILDVGTRALKHNLCGAPFLTESYVCDAALELGRFEALNMGIEKLFAAENQYSEQMANAYLALLALKRNDQELLNQILSELSMQPLEPHEVMFRLSTELFHKGNTNAVLQIVCALNRSIKKSVKIRWLEQITNNELPDFEVF